MKKSFIILFAIITMLCIVNTINASLSNASTIINPGESTDCYYYFDNQWTGGTSVTDCYGCLSKSVDNPRYASTCNYPW